MIIANPISIRDGRDELRANLQEDDNSSITPGYIIIQIFYSPETDSRYNANAL